MPSRAALAVLLLLSIAVAILGCSHSPKADALSDDFRAATEVAIDAVTVTKTQEAIAVARRKVKTPKDAATFHSLENYGELLEAYMDESAKAQRYMDEYKISGRKTALGVVESENKLMTLYLGDAAACRAQVLAAVPYPAGVAPKKTIFPELGSGTICISLK